MSCILSLSTGGMRNYWHLFKILLPRTIHYRQAMYLSTWKKGRSNMRRLISSRVLHGLPRKNIWISTGTNILKNIRIPGRVRLRRSRPLLFLKKRPEKRSRSTGIAGLHTQSLTAARFWNLRRIIGVSVI